jgi:GDP-D-mannose 3',5'-epimerase
LLLTPLYIRGPFSLLISDCEVPLNLGTEEMVSMNEFGAIAMSFDDKKLPVKHIPGTG